MIKNKINPRGTVTINVRDTQGNILETHQSSNLVVLAGRQGLAQLIGAGDTDYQVTTMGFGEDGTTPAASDTALTNQYDNAFVSITYPAANQVEFAFQMLASEGNGQTYRELGLLMAGGDLFARYTWGGSIDKTAAISLDGSWLIEF